MTPEAAPPVRDGVLVTRPQTSADSTGARLAALGFRAVAAPFLRITTRSPRLPAGAQAILVTSANALATLPPSDLPLLAVGDATAEAARHAGFSDVHSAGRDAAALEALALRLANPARGTLVLACGSRQGFGLQASLRAHGFAVARRVLYRADPVATFPDSARRELEQARLHGALFLSAETAAAFARLLPATLIPALQAVRAVAIGKPAADALDALPWRDLRVACTPTLDGVLTQL